MKASILKLGIVLLLLEKIYAQGTMSFISNGFRNLNFEAAQLPILPEGQFGGSVATSDALPGWIAYYGFVGNQLQPSTQVLHNGISLGGPDIAVYGPNFTPSYILNGNYSLQVKSGARNSGLVAAVGQSAQIPSTANSLMFNAKDYGFFFGGLQVSFAGNLLPLTLVTSNVGYDVIGVHIAAYAGQTGELRFTAVPGDPITGYGGAILDDIHFSVDIVPEPSTFSLLIGGLFVLAYRGIRRREP